MRYIWEGKKWQNNKDFFERAEGKELNIVRGIMNSKLEKEKGRPMGCSGCAEVLDEKKMYWKIIWKAWGLLILPDHHSFLPELSQNIREPLVLSWLLFPEEVHPFSSASAGHLWLTWRHMLCHTQSNPIPVFITESLMRTWLTHQRNVLKHQRQEIFAAEKWLTFSIWVR